jgi:hypothetical protein
VCTQGGLFVSFFNMPIMTILLLFILSVKQQPDYAGGGGEKPNKMSVKKQGPITIFSLNV